MARRPLKDRPVSKPIPMTEWQAANLPDSLPLHIRRNIDEGDGGCWLWNRSLSKDGYGWASLDNRTAQAHRLIYKLLAGDPGELVLDHLCRVRRCVNPKHLEPVTPAENLRRSELTPAGAKRCVRGHEFSPWNGQNRCLVCRADYEQSRKLGLAWESRRPWTKGGALSRSKDKGTAFETLVTRFLRGRLGDARIDRMPLRGTKDEGDISGIRTLLGEKVVVECKNHKKMSLGSWLSELDAERGNADAKVGVIVHKRHGKGSARDQLVTMTLEDFAVLVGADREWDD